MGSCRRRATVTRSIPSEGSTTMNHFWERFSGPFLELRLDQQFVIVLVTICCIALVAWSVRCAARSIRPKRVSTRRFIGRPVLVSWRDGVGFRESDDGCCRDISTGGMALELPFPLKVRTRLNFRVSEENLSGSGVVCRCKPTGSQYAVGVRFDPLMRSAVSLQLQNHGGVR